MSLPARQTDDNSHGATVRHELPPLINTVVLRYRLSAFPSGELWPLSATCDIVFLDVYGRGLVPRVHQIFLLP